MSHEPVVVTGVGVVSPLGRSPGELWMRLLAGESSTRSWPDLAEEGHRATAASRIADLGSVPTRRGQTLALLAAEQAVRAAGLRLPSDAGIYVGSTLGESRAFEQAAEDGAGSGEVAGLSKLEDFTVASFTRALRRRFGLGGPHQSIANACAAGNCAVGAALRALRAGRVPVALAGAAEPFSRLAMVGFARSRAMAADACRPFDRQRSGMILGEGAAFFVLEPAGAALRRGATPLAEVVSLGLSCDAHHATSPLPDGSGMRAAMLAALEEGGVGADAIQWVNAHGSGTRLSDAAEARALTSLFGARMPFVTGSKGALGHALGAASALELAICIEGLRAQTVPPTAGHREPDDALPLGCAPGPHPASLTFVLNNAFAFGGVNSSLLVRRWEPGDADGSAADRESSGWTSSPPEGQDRSGGPFLVDSARGALVEEGETAAAGALADRLAPLFEAPGDPARAGLFVASMNAGAGTSVRFWAEARRHGLGLASPELFPMTLANGPAGLLARRFRIMGPSATFTGRADALLAAVTQAADELGSGRIETAFVVALDLAWSPDQPTSYAAVRLQAAPGEGPRFPLGLAPTDTSDDPPAARALCDLIDSLEAQARDHADGGPPAVTSRTTGGQTALAASPWRPRS
jgi:3-oxoacyl-[acyl-carrier-protein] synthase II